jgi:hypothetical protein
MIRNTSNAVCMPALCAIALACFAAPVHAQNNRAAEVQHRNDCRLAAQTLRTGNPAPKLEWARNYIPTCEEEGPEVLATEWLQTSGDIADLRYLVFHSGRLRDARLFSAMRSVALDQSRPVSVRVGAMLGLSRYVDPGNAIWFSDLRAPAEPVRRIPLVTSWSTAANQLSGAEPISTHVADAVLQLFDGISAQRDKQPIEVWYAAAVLATRVRADIASGRAR